MVGLTVFDCGSDRRCCGVGSSLRVDAEAWRATTMTTVFVMLGGVVLFVSAIGVYDILARRQHRRARAERHSA